MSFSIKAAKPTNNRLLIAIAGPQASGKTTSALRLATGITQITGGKICLIDTENRRALRYAKDFNFNHMEFSAPYNPARYQEAIQAAMAAGYQDGDVIIIDSMSHEHDGPGGVLEMHDSHLDKMAGQDWKKREKLTFTAWIKPKAERSRCIQMGLNQCRAHIILCFRAKEKTKIVKNDQGKTEVINDGLQPIGGDEYFYEMDITMMLPQGAAGKPDWSEKAGRINELGNGPLKHMLHNTNQISEDTGAALAKLSMVEEAATPTPEEAERARLRARAGEILKEIKEAPTTDAARLIWDRNKTDLSAIKTISEAGYKALEKAFNDRTSMSDAIIQGAAAKASGGCNTCGGGDPGCPDCGGNS